MRSIGLRLPLLVVVILGLGSARATAQRIYLETVDWVPTSSVLTVPTSYVVASSTVVPTAFALPTVYATTYVTERYVATPTTYLVPTYYETRIRPRRLLGRPLFPTSRTYYLPTTAYYPTAYYFPTTYYAPTTYYSPTVLDTSVIATEYEVSSSQVCDEVATPAPARPAPARQPSPSAAPAPRSGQRERPSRIESEPAEEPALSSDVESVPEYPAPERKPRVEPEAAPKPKVERPKPSDTPPLPTRPEREKSTAKPVPAQPQPASPAPAPAPSSPGPAKPTVKAPTAPAEDIPLAPAAPTDDIVPAPAEEQAGAGETRREARKPVLPTRTLRPEFRNVLFGKVRSHENNEPEEGVRITLSSRLSTFEDRVTLTDAFGRFAVKVPDGDWTVRVTMPSGRVYAVSRITVSNGLIIDDSGRDVPSLIITR